MERKSKPLKCPRCGKRACDISEIPKEKIFHRNEMPSMPQHSKNMVQQGLFENSSII